MGCLTQCRPASHKPNGCFIPPVSLRAHKQPGISAEAFPAPGCPFAVEGLCRGIFEKTNGEPQIFSNYRQNNFSLFSCFFMYVFVFQKENLIFCKKPLTFSGSTAIISKSSGTTPNPWGCSSLGRALEWHSRGKGFDPPHLHHKPDCFGNLVFSFFRAFSVSAAFHDSYFSECMIRCIKCPQQSFDVI